MVKAMADGEEKGDGLAPREDSSGQSGAASEGEQAINLEPLEELRALGKPEDTSEAADAPQLQRFRPPVHQAGRGCLHRRRALYGAGHH